MMPIYKPEKINGQIVAKPYTRGPDGIMSKLESSSVLYPPSCLVEHYKEPVGALVEREAQRIVGMRAMTTSELRQRLHAFAMEVLENDKRTL